MGQNFLLRQALVGWAHKIYLRSVPFHYIVSVSKLYVFVLDIHGPCTKWPNLYRNIFDSSKYFETSFRDCSTCFSKIQINEILESLCQD